MPGSPRSHLELSGLSPAGRTLFAAVILLLSACSVVQPQNPERGICEGGPEPAEPTRAQALAAIHDLGVDDPTFVAEVDARGATLWFWTTEAEEGYTLLTDLGEAESGRRGDPSHVRAKVPATIEYRGGTTCIVDGRVVSRTPGWLIGHVSDDQIEQAEVTWRDGGDAEPLAQNATLSEGYFLLPVPERVNPDQGFSARFLDGNGNVVTTASGPG